MSVLAVQVADEFHNKQVELRALDHPSQGSRQAPAIRYRSHDYGPATMLGKWRIAQERLTMGWTVAAQKT
jgi:hypothetical protein